MRFLGIDPGGKRLGLALGDDVTGLATPLEVVGYGSRDHAVGVIAAAMNTHDAEIAIIGLPTNAEGARTPACARSEALAAALSEVGIETELQAEYLSTDEARRRARSIGRRSDRPVDDIAAQVIIEEYLELRRNRTGSR
jgi:putative Holliday junction resolvase